MANAKIMIVESDTLIAKDIEERLKTLEYTVCAVAPSGSQAIEKASETRPDLALIATALGDKEDGIEVAREIYNRFDIPVVYLTNYVNEDLLKKVKTTRAFGHVFTPYETNQLHLSIENHLYWHKEDSKFKEQEEWLSTILNSIGDAVITTDESGFITFMNPIAECLTDWQLEKAAGMYITDVFKACASEQGRSVRTNLENALCRGTIVNRGLSVTDHDITLIAKSGLKIPIDYNAKPLRNKRGDITGIVVAFCDVTKHKDIEDQLEQTIDKLLDQTQLMETVLNSISDGVIASDTNGEYLIFNPSMEQLIGKRLMPDIELDRRSEVYNLFWPDGETLVPAEELPLTRAIRGEATDNVELLICNPEMPQNVRISVTGRPIRDQNGNRIGGVVLVRDITALKEAEDKLQQTVQQLQDQTQLMDTIFNSISDGVVATSEKAEFLLVNPSAEKIVGMGETEANSGEWAKEYGTFYPDKVTPFPSEELPLVQAMQGKKTDGVDLFIRNPERPDGLYIRVSGRPLWDEQENALRGGVIVLRDITALKEAEDQLQQTVQQLRNQTQLMDTIFNSISDGVIVADGEGRYTMYNSSAAQITGHEFESIKIEDGPEKYGLLLPDKKTHFPADQLPLAQALRGKATDNVELFVHNPAKPGLGTHVILSGRPLRDEQGIVRGGVAVARDITKLKEAQLELQQTVGRLKNQTELMETIFHNLSDGIVAADARGRFTFANPSAKKLIGLDLTEVGFQHQISLGECTETYGFFYLDKVTPYPGNELPLIRAIHGKETNNVEMFVRNAAVPEGKFISVSGKPIRNQLGIKKGGVIVMRDVTEQALAQEALARAFAQGRLEIVDTILHNIGNAINTVTAGIETLHRNLTNNRLIGRFSAVADAIKAREDDWSDYIKNDPQGQKVLPFMIALAEDFTEQNDRLLRRVERVRHRAAHIADIVITQKSFGNLNLVRKDISVQKAIGDAVNLQQDALHKRGIQLDIDCENAPKEIRIQESQFHQMLVNLVKNSIEAIDELAESGGLKETPRIQIRSYINEDFLNIDITDNGIGIAEEHAKAIFAAGYTTKESGSGLGLHSSANFVIGAGGQIQPLSEGEGKGATMRVMLQLSSVNGRG